MKDNAHPMAVALRESCRKHSQRIEKLEHEIRLRREFIANSLHDIRSALSAVRGYLETSLVNTDLSLAAHRDYVAIAHKHTVRLGALVSELFALSMLDDIELSTQREPFSLSELAMDTAIEFKLQADKKKIRLELDIGAKPAVTVGNIAQIQRVLENLIGNAIRFTPEAGKVTISVVTGSDSITVAVSDSGPGIPEDCLPRVFDRFYRTSPENDPASRSAGLGLAIVKQILELHDSSIGVSSTVGVGTRFEFELPLIDDAD